MNGGRVFGRWMAVASAALALAGCRGDRTAPPPPPPPAAPPAAGQAEVMLALPPLPAWNEEDTVKVTIVNRSVDAIPDAVLELFVAAPVTVLIDSAARTRPTETRTDAGVRLAFPLGTLTPGRMVEVRQGVRTPPAPAPRVAQAPGSPSPRTQGFTATDTTSRFLVRASLVTRSGSPLGVPVQDTLRIRAGSEVAAGGCGSASDVVVTRNGVGPVRVGMSEGALRSACPEARDTTWRAEGTTEKGLIALPGGQRVLAVLDRGGVVQRILIDRAGLKTAGGFGVGAEVAELRASYGRMCAGRGEGLVAVWFPNAPGISFGLDTAATKGWPPARVQSDSVPDEVTVGSMWVRQGSDDCPARPGEGTR
jgi:hypothetical protein